MILKFSKQILHLTLSIFLLQSALARNISWTEQTEGTGLPEGIRLFKGTRTSPILEAWYLDVDLNAPDLMVRSYLASSNDIVPDLTEAFGAYAAVNGGYFGGNNSYSAVIYPGEVRAQNIAALTRNGQSYPVMRSLFSINTSRQSSVDWIYHYGNLVENVYAFTEPMGYSFNQSSPLPVPEISEGNLMEELLIGIGGGPTLVNDGVVQVTYDEEVFWGSGVGLDNGDPRTAVGYTADNHVILLVVDGRQAISQGLGLPELALTMLSLGCLEAMNLDGGGSTGMAIGGDYVNHPSESRSVPSILAVVHSDSVQIPESFSHEIIIDTEDSGTTMTEGWFPSANEGYWGGTPSLLNAVGTGSEYLRFEVRLQETVTEANVYAWWVAAPNRATRTPFIIEYYEGGEHKQDTVHVDQTSDHGQWNLLGTYSFVENFGVAVKVTDAGTGGDYVVADAIRITSDEPLVVLDIDGKNPGWMELSPALNQAFPNPFNPSTTIGFSLPEPAQVSLNVYDLEGRFISTLVAGHFESGSHHVVWSGLDHHQLKVPSGIYLIVLDTHEFKDVQKVMLLK